MIRSDTSIFFFRAGAPVFFWTKLLFSFSFYCLHWVFRLRRFHPLQRKKWLSSNVATLSEFLLGISVPVILVWSPSGQSSLCFVPPPHPKKGVFSTFLAKSKGGGLVGAPCQPHPTPSQPPPHREGAPEPRDARAAQQPLQGARGTRAPRRPPGGPPLICSSF